VLQLAGRSIAVCWVERSGTTARWIVGLAAILLVGTRIDRGPYAFVRHPTYTGVLLMVLGTVTFAGTRAGAILFATMAVGLIVKAQSEER
jgi:isoprenylcysteine carboxyl methyltransferase (ICMT) family protein YpbQ